jgi:hypothetical protein
MQALEILFILAKEALNFQAADKTKCVGNDTYHQTFP